MPGSPGALTREKLPELAAALLTDIHEDVSTSMK
jgi:hypothetical protein